MKQATIYSILFLVNGALPTLAQTPDTTSAERYLPLEVGHVWEYERWVETCLGIELCWTEQAGYERWTVERDSIVGGQAYRVVAQENYTLGEELEATREIFVRFDAEQARGFRLDGEDEFPWPDYLGCRLDAPFEAQLDNCDDESGLGPVSTYEPEELAVQVGEDMERRIVKTYQSLIPGARFVADVGLLYEGGTEFGGSWIALSYARVGDLEYGTERFPVTSESAPPEFALALSVYPNPVSGAATVQLSLDAPQRVTVEVFDVLGRRVLSSDLGARPAGEVLHQLDTAQLQAGAYLVRLAGDAGAAATARIVRQ